MYEVVWLRLLGLQLGHTVAAVSTVLSAYMAGLALGAALGGRWASRLEPHRALRGYGLLEVVVAVSALAVPGVLSLFGPMLSWSYGETGSGAFGAMRVVVSASALVIPTMAMGATVPLAMRWYVRRFDQAAEQTAWVYAANTVGAAAGAAFAAFVALPAWGSARTTWIAVALNLLAAAAAWQLARAAHPVREEKTRTSHPAGRHRAASGAPEARLPGAAYPARAAVALAVTGFVALAAEVAWTRVLALVIGPTAYAFGAMLVVFIAGVGGGAWAGGFIARRATEPLRALAWTMMASGAVTAAAMWRAGGLPLRMAEAIAASEGTFRAVLLSEFAMAATTLVPVALTLGAAFPLAVRAAGGALEGIPQAVARLYTANTTGAILGSSAAGFLLIPLLGLQRTLTGCVWLVTVAGVATFLTSFRPRRQVVVFLAAAAATMAAALVVPSWDRSLMSSGAYKYAAYVDAPDVEAVLGAGTLEYYAEGAAATVSVRSVAGARTLAIDGKVDASNAGDMLTQTLLAHLPLLMHPSPRRVAIVGMGSGVTLGAALAHPIERADVLEISPEVVDAARLFTADNGGALDDPRVRVIRGDGRTHFELSQGQYEVVISEPSNPWVAGVAALFTREFFEAVNQRLAPGGVFCQWAHTYDIASADLRSIAATFRAVFPHGTMWLVGAGDLVLIGSREPLEPALASMTARAARGRVPESLARVKIADPRTIFAMYVGGDEEMRAFAEGAAPQVDDRMALEYTVPATLLVRGGTDHAESIRALSAGRAQPPEVRAARDEASPRAWRERGEMWLASEAFALAFDAFGRALAGAPGDHEAALGFVRSAAAADRMPQALSQVEQVAKASGAPAASVAWSQLLAASGATAQAIEVAKTLVQAHPNDPSGLEQLAGLAADAQAAEALTPIVAQLIQRFPDRAATAYFAATTHLLEGRPSTAMAVGEAAIRRGQVDRRLSQVLGVALAESGRRAEARRAFMDAIAADPTMPAPYLNLARLSLEEGDARGAVARAGEALLVDPAAPGAASILAEALGRMGLTARAARVRGAPAARR